MPTRSRLVPLALASLVLGVIGVVAAPAALAHTELVSSDPADGATLTAAPASVTFTFNEELLAGSGTAISVNTADGTVVESSDVTPDGDTISAPWPSDAVSGTFEVAYRVVSDDGHPVTGSITVTIDATVSGDSPPPSASAVAESSSASPSSVPAATEEAPRGIAASLVVSLAVILVVAVAVVTVIAWRRRRS